MTADSAIEWTDHTFSPWLGCTPVSAACDHCYAAGFARRYGWPDYRRGVPRGRTAPSTWKLPRRWQRKAGANGVRARIFPSLCDPYDGEVADAWRDDFMALIEETPNLDWLLLTKRPQVARKYHRRRKMPPNVALGVTAENQATADLRIPQLLAIEGPKLRFVSIEPMLGPIDFNDLSDGPENLNALTGLRENPFGATVGRRTGTKLDWVIAGGESGPNARSSHPEWVRALRDQCVAADVPFFFKQWGEYAPAALDLGPDEQEPWRLYPDGIRRWSPTEMAMPIGSWPREIMVRVGKKAAGAELDGRLWRQLPPQLQQVAPAVPS